MLITDVILKHKIKFIGRTYVKDSKLFMNFSGSGIKFSILSKDKESDAVIIIINSTEKKKRGKIMLGSNFGSIKSFLNGKFKILSNKLSFEIGPNESAVVRLIK